MEDKVEGVKLPNAAITHQDRGVIGVSPIQPANVCELGEILEAYHVFQPAVFYSHANHFPFASDVLP